MGGGVGVGVVRNIQNLMHARRWEWKEGEGGDLPVVLCEDDEIHAIVSEKNALKVLLARCAHCSSRDWTVWCSGRRLFERVFLRLDGVETRFQELCDRRS